MPIVKLKGVGALLFALAHEKLAWLGPAWLDRSCRVWQGLVALFSLVLLGLAWPSLVLSCVAWLGLALPGWVWPGLT